MSDSSDENQLDEQEGSDSQVSADDSGLSIFGGRSQLPVRVPGYVVSHTKISAGGYGTVFRARSIESNLLDAVKILTRPHVDDEDRARFLQEIRLAHGLSHRNLIVFRGDGFCQEGRYEGCPYYTMEYMDVGSFKHWLELLDISTAEGLRSAVLILAEACKGLAVLHEQGFIHRDVKPGNILLGKLEPRTTEGCPADVVDRSSLDNIPSHTGLRFFHPSSVKVSDYGIVGLIEGRTELSSGGAPIGTLAYCSPEQLSSPNLVDEKSDQWSIGIILFEILCGRRPWQTSFDKPELEDVIRTNASSKTPCPTPASVDGNVDRSLNEICNRCLEVNPSERFNGVDQLRESLEAWLNGEVDPNSRNWIKLACKKLLHPIRRRPGRFLASIAAIFIFSLSGYWTWYQFAYTWPSVARFASLTNLEGLPVGLKILSRREAEARHFHYQFVRDGWFGPLRKVYLKNRSQNVFARAPCSSDPIKLFQHDPDFFIHSEITPFDIMGRVPVAWEYDYTESGELLWITELDCLRNPITRKQFESPNVAEYEEVNSPRTLGQATQAALNPISGARFGVDWGTDIEQVQLTWDEGGVCIRSMYFGRTGQPTSDAQGAFGWDFKRDSLKRVIERQSLGPAGTPIDGIHGYATTRVQYLDNSELHTFYDVNGIEVVRSDIGASRIQFHYQSNGAVERVRTYDHDAPAASRFGGPDTRLQWKGDQVQIRHFDAQSIPMHRGDGVHQVIALFEADGRIESVRYSNRDNTPVDPRELGASRLRIDYDTSNRMKSLEMLDATGTPKRGELGASKYVFRWTPHGRPLGMSLYHNNQKVLGRFLAHQTVLQYDEAQRLRSWSCRGLNGEQVDCLAGFHSRVLTYDLTGRVESVSFWHSGKGRAVNNLLGYHRAVWSYDEKGNEMSWESFDINDQRQTDADYGCHRVERQYDEQSRNTVTICRDANLEKTLDAKGICEYRMTWENGRKGSTAAFDVNSKPMLVPGTRWHKWTHQRVQSEDERDRKYEWRYWGISGERVKTDDGYHLVKESEDERGNVIEGSYFDENEKPVTHPDGYHYYQSGYDHLGRKTSGSAFGTRREPVLAWEGYHKWRKNYDSYGNEVAGTYLDKDCKTLIVVNGHSRWTASYSISGEQLSWACFLPSGARADCDAGFHRWERTPDERGTLSEAAHYDLSDNLLSRVARVKSGATKGLNTGDLVYGRNGKLDPQFVAELLGQQEESALTTSLEEAAKWLGYENSKDSIEVIRDGRFITIPNIKSKTIKDVKFQEFFAEAN